MPRIPFPFHSLFFPQKQLVETKEAIERQRKLFKKKQSGKFCFLFFFQHYPSNIREERLIGPNLGPVIMTSSFPLVYTIHWYEHSMHVVKSLH